MQSELTSSLGLLRNWLEKKLSQRLIASDDWATQVSIRQIASLELPFWRYYTLAMDSSVEHTRSYCESFVDYARTADAPDTAFFFSANKTLGMLYRKKIRHKGLLHTVAHSVEKCRDPNAVCKAIRLLAILQYDNLNFWRQNLPHLICECEVLRGASPENVLNVIEAYLIQGKASRVVFSYLEALVLEKLSTTDVGFVSQSNQNVDTSKELAIMEALKEYMNTLD